MVSAFVTLDGVVEGPGFEEHRDGKNAWALRVQDEEEAQYGRDQVFKADALLLGRRTYQIWAAFWPTANGDEELAKRLNEIPKFVVSTKLETADWNNTTIISGDVVREVQRLKDRPGGDLVVYGSSDLVDTLLEKDLVDEFRLLVHPVILGSGKHMFHDGIATHHLHLVGSRVFDSGVVLLTYQPVQEAPTGPFMDVYSWSDEQVASLDAAQNRDRVLATVLITDIVDSTARAAEMGDKAWRDLLDRHDELAKAEVSRWLGRFIKNTGDGVLATFDTPTRALRSAFGLHKAGARHGFEIRAALHTGEVERRAEDVGGIGVHIAARALGEASSGQVIVTRTVRDLATGTDLKFVSLGQVSLRGVPGQWELYQAELAGGLRTL